MRLSFLCEVLRWAGALLILRVVVSILGNYPDYFPPHFQSLFLEGRESTFLGLYRLAFYLHIFCGPVVLFLGLVLMNETIRRRWPIWHRYLGRTQAFLVLLILVPTSLVMAFQTFGGWAAGGSFVVLSIATGFATIQGVLFARRRQFPQHRCWMERSYVLICSAVVLRLISGMAEWVGVSHAEWAYAIASWASWILPLMALEIFRACSWGRIREDWSSNLA